MKMKEVKKIKKYQERYNIILLARNWKEYLFWYWFTF